MSKHEYKSIVVLLLTIHVIVLTLIVALHSIIKLLTMTCLLEDFFIKYLGQDVAVTPLVSATGNYFLVHLDGCNVKLKSEGSTRLLWLERGKGATPLAYALGQLIENNLQVRFCCI